MLIWAALSAELRSISRLIANEDCWTKTVFQKMAHHVGFQSLYVNRIKTLGHDSLEPLMDAFTQRNPLILFPQGTCGNPEQPQAFKSGLSNLAIRFATVVLIAI